ncbi:hypothetical protein F8S13_17790 [Chloroflexia bacterium SDU3-3]|nr:hypothetical protein F8S13_17790 [Chloroflexia bacterium SDU3-3]
MRFLPLEALSRRAPLGLRCLDLARGLNVTDGLMVAAYPLGGPALRRVAQRSPMSGIYGFRALPGLRSYEQGQAPASDWCADPGDGGTPSGEALHDLPPLLALVEANSTPVSANFAVEISDTLGRFLPQVMQMCLPKEHLVEVPLFSAPARPPPPGSGVVRGEIYDPVAGGPASWAIVSVSPEPGTTYVGMADARGMFAVSLPYASALPSLGGTSIDQLAWDLAIGVRYQPSVQRSVAGSPADGPPDMRSILEQATAGIRDSAPDAAAVASITRPIRFGSDLRAATGSAARLLIEPAP